MPKRKKEQLGLFDEVSSHPKPQGVRKPFDNSQQVIHSKEEADIVTSEKIKQFEERNKHPTKPQVTKRGQRYYSLSQAEQQIAASGEPVADKPFFDGYDKLGLALEKTVRTICAFAYHMQRNDGIENASEAQIHEMLEDNFPDGAKKKRQEMAKLIANNLQLLADGTPGFLLRLFNRVYSGPIGYQVPLIGPRISPNVGAVREVLPYWEPTVASVANHSKRLYFEFQVTCVYGRISLVEHPLDMVLIGDDNGIRVVEIKSSRYPIEPNVSHLLERLVVQRSAEHLDPKLGVFNQRISLRDEEYSTKYRISRIGELWYLGSAPDYGTQINLSNDEKRQVFEALDNRLVSRQLPDAWE